MLLTPAGVELAEPMFAQAADSLRPLTSELGAADQVRLQKLLAVMLTGTLSTPASRGKH
ncbi:hypothetical protein [Subtercola lobariae]|uniref:hypothetical protein n=1 Tax=Subtercola lobariae TaxID=1588641 RepID=UPI001E4F264F|nr:hypothetical protein [Subtercola lobariae]